MPFEVAYKLSKDTYPEVTIGLYGTTVDKGRNGTYMYTPQSIRVEIQNKGLIDIEDLVQAYLHVHEPQVGETIDTTA